MEEFEWDPAPGANCIIGPGDSGKSTVLAAISLLFAPFPVGGCSEFDYYRRRVDKGFKIEAHVGGLDTESLATQRGTLPPLRGWKDGKPTPLPDEDGAEAVLVCRVKGTADLEVIHDLPVGGDEALPFTPGMRKKMLLARLASGDRSARDLRISPGSLLERHLGKTDIRGAVQRALGVASGAMETPEGVDEAMQQLRVLFKKNALPSDLHLGIVAQQGTSLAAMVSLLEGDDPSEAIPLSNAGVGTRQLALLSMSAALVERDPILVVDEPERGLEPYRQRVAAKRMIDLIGEHGQAFLTTHSPSILQSMPEGAVWWMRLGRTPARFTDPLLVRLLRTDPEAFFAPVPVFCEGDTEIGLLQVLLPHYIGADLGTAGIRLIEGWGGHDRVIKAVNGVADAGIQCGAFLDNEDFDPEIRERLRERCTLFVWDGVCNIEEAVCKWLPLHDLLSLFPVATETTGNEERYLVDQVQNHISEKVRQGGPMTVEILERTYQEKLLRDAILAAMSAKKGAWFKSIQGGRLLGEALIRLGIPKEMEGQLKAFAKHVRDILR